MNSYFRKIEDKRRMKKLYEETKNRASGGAWFNEKKNRYIRYSVSEGGNGKYWKRKSNRKLRRTEGAFSRNLYRRLLDYWWILY